MAYDNNDKLAFALKDAKYSIGVGRGSAMNNAIQFVLEHYKDETDSKTKLDLAFDIADEIFEYQQKAIEKDYSIWLEANETKLKMELGLIEKTIDSNTGELTDI